MNRLLIWLDNLTAKYVLGDPWARLIVHVIVAVVVVVVVGGVALALRELL